ncbi:MAG: archease [Thermoguttaceae bacterium]|nr:archease [Thermoguttaceae bacterium]MDW8038213.1 archease [Thermoguttaceae bacterium]
MYETFDHTADLGLRIQAETLERLFEEAAEALSSVLVVNWEQVRPVLQKSVRLEASNWEDLLHDWLSELLVLFALQKLVGRRFEVRFDHQNLPVGGPPEAMGRMRGPTIQLPQEVLEATIWGDMLDPARYQPGPEVKAVTYHGLRLEKQPTGWLAEVILDL